MITTGPSLIARAASRALAGRCPCSRRFTRALETPLARHAPSSCDATTSHDATIALNSHPGSFESISDPAAPCAGYVALP